MHIGWEDEQINSNQYPDCRTRIASAALECDLRGDVLVYRRWPVRYRGPTTLSLLRTRLQGWASRPSCAAGKTARSECAGRVRDQVRVLTRLSPSSRSWPAATPGSLRGSREVSPNVPPAGTFHLTCSQAGLQAFSRYRERLAHRGWQHFPAT